VTILTDLCAALEAKREAEAEHRLARRGNDHDEKVAAAECVNRAIDDLGYLLTDDTIRALLDVAEAMRDTCIMGAAEHEDGLIIPPRQVQVIASKLAPLVKEDCPTCHGLGGGGGGFDRNGSHTEGRYCEYPCPNCGREVDHDRA
jgi:hypothetical protein